jgi:hypothetical protein
MSDNPFKEEESMSVFKEEPSTEVSKGSVFVSKEKKQSDDGGYAKFPHWDLLPPFKLIKRGKNK